MDHYREAFYKLEKEYTDIYRENARLKEHEAKLTDVEVAAAAHIYAEAVKERDDDVARLRAAIEEARPKLEEGFQAAKKAGIESEGGRHAWSYIYTASQILRRALRGSD